MVNTKDEIKSEKLSNIGHTITLIRDLEKQVKAMND